MQKEIKQKKAHRMHTKRELRLATDRQMFSIFQWEKGDLKKCIQVEKDLQK